MLDAIERRLPPSFSSLPVRGSAAAGVCCGAHYGLTGANL